MNRYCITLLLLLSFYQLYANENIAVVAKAGGTVSHLLTDSESWQSLKAGTLLQEKVSIKTGEDGYAVVIYLDDKSTVKIRPNSNVVLSSSVQQGKIHKTIQMSVGEALHSVTKSNRQYRVETPTSVASVKGTEFFTVVSPVDSSTVYYGIEGVVTIAGANGDTVELMKKYKVIATKDGLFIYKMSEDEWSELKKLLKEMERYDFEGTVSHTLELTTNRGGTVTPQKAITIPDNTPYTITATASENHIFSKWQIRDGHGILFNPLKTETEVMLNGSDIQAEAIFFHKDSIPESERIRLDSTYDSSTGDTTKSDTDSIFSKNYFMLILHTDSHTSITGNDTIYGEIGNPVLIEAVSQAGHTFNTWSIEKGSADIIEPHEAATTILPHENTTIKAHSSADSELLIRFESSDGRSKNMHIIYR